MSDKTIAVQVDPYMGDGIAGYGVISGEQVIQLLWKHPYLNETSQREMLKDPYRFEAIVVDRRHYEHVCEIAEQMRTVLTRIVEAQVPSEISDAAKVLAAANKHGGR